MRSYVNEHYDANCELVEISPCESIRPRSHEAHFPLKRLYFSSPKLVLLQLMVEVK